MAKLIQAKCWYTVKFHIYVSEAIDVAIFEKRLQSALEQTCIIGAWNICKDKKAHE